MTDLAMDIARDTSASPDEIERIGQVLSRMRLMIGRRLIGRLAIENVAPGLELSHLDVLDAIRRAGSAAEVTVGTIAETMRIDPSRASRIVADMVGRGVLRRAVSPGDARRIVVEPTALGTSLLAEIKAVKAELVATIVAEWPEADVAAFAHLFERFIGGLERVYASRDKLLPNDPIA